MTRAARHARRGAGFSLVEVLIAVLILALGLLGLGAVFPVIVREQKIGNDIIMGTLAGNSARALLQGMDLGAASGLGDDFWTDVRDALDNNDGRVGRWTPAFMDAFGLQTGLITFIDSDHGELKIPLKQRLFPVDTRSAQPQFVWDLAVQRIPDGDTALDNDDLRVAVFVRRIDTRLRVPTGVPLYRALTDDTLPQASRRVPVAEDMDGVPTYDGLGATPLRYSQIRKVNVIFDYDPAGTPDQRRRDRLYVRGTGNTLEWRLAKQPNQKLIDNLGNVYTVLEAGSADDREFVRVSPEVPAFVTEDDRILEVAFTPQVAAAIVTWRVTP